MQNKIWEDVHEALNMEGPGLTDFVSAEELDQLISGELPAATVAARYHEAMGIAEGLTRVKTSEAQSLADLLDWVRYEIHDAIQDREQVARDDAMEAKLRELRDFALDEVRRTREARRRKVALCHAAFEMGATKTAVAWALDITRPTLDRLLRETE